MVSTELSALFPHQTIRAGQDDLIKDILIAFSKGKTLLANAPTGLGKTASALTVAISEAKKNKKKIFFLTNRHTQHKIAVDTLQQIKKKTGQEIICADLIGKRWMCNQSVAGLFGNDFNEYCRAIVEKGECEFYNNVIKKRELQVEAKLLIKELKITGPFHNEELIRKSHQQRMCGYELTLALAKDADVIIGDYYYLFNPFVASRLLNKLDIEFEDIILIIDEGHNLPQRITDMLSSNLTNNMIKNGLMEAKKFGYNGLVLWLEGLEKLLQSLSNFTQDKERLIRRETFTQGVNMVVDYEQLNNEIEAAAAEIRKKQRRSFLGGISTFLTNWQDEEEEGYTRILSEKEGKYGPLIVLSHSCLDPAIITKNIFARVHAALIMSGTLQPTFMYRDVLGITEGTERVYNSPFPPQNRLSLIIPKTSTKYSLRGPEMYQQIADISSELCKLIPGNITLFFPSYYLRDSIAELIVSDKKKFWEKSSMSKEEKEQLLAEFKEAKQNGGLLLGVTGANFAEGVDFPGDLLQGVIVIGIPLARPNLKTKEIISYYQQKFARGWDYGYLYPAMNKCLQSAGRCIRSETDKGAIIFLDERFVWQKYYDCFADKVGLRVAKDYKKTVKEFFQQ